MGKFAKVANAFMEWSADVAAYDAKVNELTYKLMSRTQGVEFDQAKAIATVLINQTEITWK